MANMRPECLKAVATALGRPITVAEGRNIVSRLQSAMRDLAERDPKNLIGKPTETRLAEAAQLAAQRLVGEAKLKQKRVELSIKAKEKTDTYIKAQAAKGVGDGLDSLDRMLAPKRDAKDNITSVDSQVHAITDIAMGRLSDAWEAIHPKFLGLFQNKDAEDALILALHGDKTVPAEYVKGAEEFHSVAEDMRQRYNAAGGKVGKLDNWGMPHNWTDRLALSAGQEAYVNDYMRWTDRSIYRHEDGTRFNDDEMRDFFKQAWTSIVTNGANKQVGAGTIGSASVKANRHGQERQIHFKDAQSALEAYHKYSGTNLFQTLSGHVRSMARDTALTETFGPNSDHLFKQTLDEQAKKAALANPADTGKILSQQRWLSALYDNIAGNNPPPVRNWVANMFQDVRNYLSASMLGSAPITAITDEATMMATARANNIPTIKLWENEARAFSHTDDKDVMRRAGLLTQSMMESLNRFGGELGGPRFSAKLNEAAMRASGMLAMDSARNRAFSVSMMDTLGSLTRRFESLDDLHPEDHKILLGAGITPEDWKIWRAAQPEDWKGNHNVLTADSVMRVGDKEVDAAIPTRLERIQNDASNKIRELGKRNAQESEWIAKREDKFNAARDAINRNVKELAAQKTTAASEAIDRINGTMQQLEHSFAAAKRIGAADKNLSDALDLHGADFFKSGKDYGTALTGISKDLAALRQERAGINRNTSSESLALEKQATTRIADLHDELNDFIQRSQERVTKREAVMSRIGEDMPKQIARARQDAKEQAATRLMAHVNDERAMALPFNRSAREEALFNQGIDRGTIKGELLKSFYMFKSFPWAMFTRHWQRGLQAYDGVAGKAGYLIPLIATQTILGAIALETNDTLWGKNPRNLSPENNPHLLKNWIAAFTKGGALGFYGDLIFSDQDSAVAGTAGPFADTLDTLDDLTRRNALREATGEPTDAGGKLVRLAKRALPGTNLWYTKAVLDHLIFQNMQEFFSPGYLSRMQSRAQQRDGTSYWWKPGHPLSQATVPQIGGQQ